MPDILCPNCGMPNPGDQNVCSFCRQPLKSVQDSKPIKPGDMPTKKITADLEPILPDWLREAREKARRAAEETAIENAKTDAQQPPAPSESAVQDWLAGLDAASHQEDDEEIPEWMRGTAVPTPSAKQEKPEESFPRRQEIHWENEPAEEEISPAARPVTGSELESGSLPAWMRSAEKESSEEKEDVSDWLTKQTASPAEEKEQQNISPFADGTFRPVTGELSSWLDKMAAEAATSSPAETPAPQPSENGLPNWLANLPRESEPVAPAGQTSIESGGLDWTKAETPAEPEKTDSFGADLDLPNWMNPNAEEKGKISAPDWNPPVETPAAPKETEEPMPDWMAAFRNPEEKNIPAESSPAFVADAEPMEQGKVEELFSVEMPDWLSNITPTDQKSGETQETPQEPITLAELPSWVKAMRPVETALYGLDDTPSPANQPLEESGPLAGLRGVLPSTPGFLPSGKPKAYSILLQTTESQQENATLLDQILAAETKTKPLSGESVLRSQRILRRGLAAFMLILVTFILLAGTRLIPLPGSPWDGTRRTLTTLDSIPEGAPALLIFDYEPALAGELEAAAAPLVDRLIGLRHPRLTILSTSPTGAALAERFMRTTQANANYLPGQNYLNLGYLPGGTAGLLAFVDNPRSAMPLSADGNLAWESAAVQGVTRFSDYKIVILITDQAETARAWVEQTTAGKGGQPMLIVSSAQAAPMIVPYLSGQIDGLIGGIHDGAALEGVTGYEGPVRDYWDTYNLSLLVVVAIIVIGSMWNFIAGVRSRRQSLEEI